MGLTDDPNDPRLRQLRERSAQQEAYLVLSNEERAKGFVRPLRFVYVHVGRAVCGKPRVGTQAADRGFLAYVCSGRPAHEGECDSWLPVRTEAEASRLERTGFLGGCGAETRMAPAIAETYARDPGFYGATFCVQCNDHLPVGEFGEFVWADDGQRVGT